MNNMPKKFFNAIVAAICLVPLTSYAQKFPYGFEEGCVNFVDVGTGPGTGKYGDRSFTVYYSHEKLLSDNLLLGVGIGWNHHDKYDATTLPLYLNLRYFFVDKPFSPFVNMKLGGFGILSKKNADTNQKYSLSKKSNDFNLFFSPSAGIKWRFAENFGVQATISYDSYLLNVYDEKTKDYKNKLVGNIAFSLGFYFQIEGF
jgi:hypothetical protein